jgi:cytochrome oxidase assembly protein ShyY1
VFEGDLTASAVEHLAAAAGAAPVDVDTEPPRREAGLPGERATTPDAGSAMGAMLDWAVALGIALVAIIAVALLPESGCAAGHVIPDRPRTTVSAH